MARPVLSLRYSVLKFMTFFPLRKNIRPNNHYILILHTYVLFLALYPSGSTHA